MKNDYVIDGGVSHVILRNRHKNIVSMSKIDTEDLITVKKHSWHLTIRGYVESRIGGKLKKLHHFVSGFSYCDHINHSKTDNTKSNLRFADNASNSRNKLPNGKSKYKGVWFCNTTKRWCSSIRYRKVRKWLGRFDTEIEAAIAYNNYAINTGDEFLYLNKVGDV